MKKLESIIHKMSECEDSEKEPEKCEDGDVGRSSELLLDWRCLRTMQPVIVEKKTDSFTGLLLRIFLL